MYKVFYNDRIVFFAEDDQNYKDQKGQIIHYFKNKKYLRLAINQFVNNTEIHNLVIIHPDIDSAFKKFKKLYKLIDAAGGLVKNASNKILVIHRRGKWDLPKGKLEKNELPESGALREVEEECGISNLEIKQVLETTYHTYKLNGKKILKRTFWFEMSYFGDQNPTPQTEEDITEVKWIEKNEITEITDNSFGSILEVFKSAGLF